MKFGKIVRPDKEDTVLAAAQAAREGFGFVQVGLARLKEPIPKGRKLAEIAEGLAAVGIETAIHSPFLHSLAVASPDKKVREKSIAKIGESFSFAAGIGAKYAAVHVSTKVEKPSSKAEREKQLRTALESAERIVAMGGEAGVPACLENTKFPLSTVEEAERFAGIPGARLCLDAGHVLKMGYDENGRFPPASEFAKWLSTLGPSILSAHLHDVAIVDGDAVDHIPLGDGAIDYGRFLRGLSRTPCEYVLLEIGRTAESEERVPNARVLESLAKARKALKRA